MSDERDRRPSEGVPPATERGARADRGGRAPVWPRKWGDPHPEPPDEEAAFELFAPDPIDSPETGGAPWERKTNGRSLPEPTDPDPESDPDPTPLEAPEAHQAEEPHPIGAVVAVRQPAEVPASSAAEAAGGPSGGPADEALDHTDEIGLLESGGPAESDVAAGGASDVDGQGDTPKFSAAAPQGQAPQAGEAGGPDADAGGAAPVGQPPLPDPQLAPAVVDGESNGSGEPREAGLNGSEPPLPSRPLPTGFIIAMANQKGGVGKTTTTINLGAALAEQGAKVLLVDFDPQGALSVGLGLNPSTLELTVYDLLLDSSLSFRDVVLSSKLEGLDLLPSNIDLAAAEIMLVNEVAREQMLKRALAPAQEVYNYVLIDCPPSLGLLTVNALTAATGVLIPLECEYFALRGMALLLDTIEKVRNRLNPGLRVEGILATMLDGRTLHAREVLSRVNEAFGDKLFQTLVHKTIRFAEAPVVGEPILTYAPQSNGADEYRNLAREVMSR